jgi:putative CocE/NonD family hydrolase
MTTTINSVKYLTPPLTEDVEVTGPIALYLYAAIDQEDTNWIVALRDVAPDGREIELTRGWLKASHRAVDETKSEPWRPWHPHLNPGPVVPGGIYEYPIEIISTSNVFKAGHRIKLEIMSLDYPGSTPLHPGLYPRLFPNHMCSSKTTLHKIYRDKEHQSYLLLPIIPKT